MQYSKEHSKAQHSGNDVPVAASQSRIGDDEAATRTHSHAPHIHIRTHIHDAGLAPLAQITNQGGGSWKVVVVEFAIESDIIYRYP
jgi:hypothetical protein